MASKKYGVAKEATLVPIRVLNCTGNGNTATLLAGLDWIAKNHPAGTNGIVNMSLAGVKNEKVNQAVNLLNAIGLAVVVAAGNSNVDACSLSPASATSSIAAGSISNTKNRSTFSNWGDCVDIFAPGERIESITANNYLQGSSRTGTSQSAPFVAGVLATYWSKTPSLTVTELESKLYELAEKSVVVNGKSRRNDLANVEKLSINTIIVEDPIAVDEPAIERVAVNQWRLGKPFGTLKWEPVEGATEYRLYKTGSIRPQWRLFRLISKATEITVSDRVGSIAMYKVVAIVPSGEVQVGTVRYAPKK
jgi:subtilisin family serine protease